MGSSRKRDRNRREEKTSFCTWPKIFGFVLALAIACFLIWWFEPWKRAEDGGIEISFGGSSSNGNGDTGFDGGGDRPPTLKPEATLPPTSAATAEFKFMQCDPDNTGLSDCCNGLEGICDLRANEVTYATLHNGMATLEGGFLFGPNHRSPLEEALEAGYRGLNLDICNCGGELIFCHGICALGPRDVVEVMQNVNEFLDKNPTETIVFIYQVDNGADQMVDLNAFYDKLLLVDGLVEKMYVHEGRDTPWPTLRQLTTPAFNKRIIMFHYNGPNCNIDPGGCPDGLHLYYNYASDNDWDHPDAASIADRSTSCQLVKNGINSRTFVGLNNFVSPPKRSAAKEVNEYAAAKDYINDCMRQLGEDINFVLVDFWSEGDLLRVTQEHNAKRALQRRQRERDRNLREPRSDGEWGEAGSFPN